MAKTHQTAKYILAAATMAVSAQAMAANAIYTWNGGTSGSTWNALSTNKVWTDSNTVAAAWTNTVSNDALFTTANATVTAGAALTAGTLEFTADGVLITTGATARTISLGGDGTANNLRGSLRVGTGLTSTIGNNITVSPSGSNILDITGGGTLTIGNLGKISSTAGPNVLVTQGTTLNVASGGQLTVSLGSMSLGHPSYISPTGNNNTLNITGGTATLSGSLNIGINGATGCAVSVSSGSLTAATLKMYGSSNLTLSGSGVIAASSIAPQAGATNMVVNLNGGTLRGNTSTGSFWALSNFLTANVQAGGAAIDSQSYSILIAQPLVHSASLGVTPDGGLTKSGLGTLTLTGTNTYTGTTTVSAGTLMYGANNVIYTGAVNISGSGTLNVGTYTDSVGAVTLSSGGALKIAANQTGAAQLQSTGALDLGSGNTLDLSGMATGAGLYRIASGSSLTGTFGTVSGLDSNYTLKYGTVTANELDAQHKASIALALGSNVANVHVGSQTVNLNIGNTAPIGSATLNYTLGGVNGSGTRAPGDSGASTAITGSYSATAGVNSFTISASDTNATNTATVSFSQTAYNLASASTSPATVNLATIHAGGAFAPAAVTIQNTALSGSYTEGLDASKGTLTGDATFTGNNVSNLAGGLTSNALLVGLASANTGVAGPKSGTAVINLTSNGSNSSLSSTALGSQTITVQGGVFNGDATWNGNSDNNFGSANNWADSSGIKAVPGTFAGFTTTDTAAIALSGSTINMNQAASLKSLTLTGSGGTLGTGSLTINGGVSGSTSTGSMSINGNHTIATDVDFASNSTLSVSTGSTATFTGSLTKQGTVLTINGGGNVDITGTGKITGTSDGNLFNSDLVVDGTTVTFTNGNSDYYGPTIIQNSGKIILAADNALPSSTHVTVNSGSTLDVGSHSLSVAVLNVDSTAILTGTGTITAPVTILGGGEISPAGANNPGTLTASSLTVDGKYLADIQGTNSADLLNVSGALDITIGSTLALNDMGIIGDTYLIAQYGSWNGTKFTNVTGLPTGATLTYGAHDLVVTIPEPSTAALVLGLSAMFGIGRRRRQSPNRPSWH